MFGWFLLLFMIADSRIVMILESFLEISLHIFRRYSENITSDSSMMFQIDSGIIKYQLLASFSYDFFYDSFLSYFGMRLGLFRDPSCKGQPSPTR